MNTHLRTGAKKRLTFMVKSDPGCTQLKTTFDTAGEAERYLHEHRNDLLADNPTMVMNDLQIIPVASESEASEG